MCILFRVDKTRRCSRSKLKKLRKHARVSLGNACNVKNAMKAMNELVLHSPRPQPLPTP